MKEKTNNIIKKVCMVIGVGTIFGLALGAMIYAPIVYGQTDKLLKKTHKIQTELTRNLEEKQTKDKQLIDKQIKVNSQKQIENNKSQQEFTKKVEEQQKKIDIKTNTKININKKEADKKINKSWNYATSVGNSSQEIKKSIERMLQNFQRVVKDFMKKSGINKVDKENLLLQLDALNFESR